ncbi:hypothetical protein D5S17_27630 [Pseudonocardiaceae bacterium YIM PH 21723]|nr:hypothetical protein D5S17_27630 [Pseudonocardiaceae bacterium YIM PH 21723]
MNDHAVVKPLPWWLLGLSGLIFAVLLAGPALADHHRELGIPQFPFTVLVAPLMLFVLPAFQRRSGMQQLWNSPALIAERPRALLTILGSAAVVLGLYLSNVTVWPILGCSLLGGILYGHMLWRVNRIISSAPGNQVRPGG